MVCATPMPGRGEGPGGARPPRIAANILAADLACVGHEIAAAVRAGAELVHVDVMDLGGAGVTVAPLVCRALKRVTRAPLEVHLLVQPAERLVAAFAAAGADLVVFHPEASDDVARTAALLRSHGCAVGIALAAGSPLDVLDPLAGAIDEIVVTGVAGGRAADRVAAPVLRWLRALRGRLVARHGVVAVCVDGGVDAANAAELVAAGADALVVESAGCRAQDRADAVAALRRVLGAPAGSRRRGPGGPPDRRPTR
jgi:ribulose-phosphate 3-epimerase